MKHTVLFLSSLIILFFVSCDNGTVSESDLKNAELGVYEKGDKGDYLQILGYYEHLEKYESTLPYSMIMAYKYKDSDAYFNLYETTVRLFNNRKFSYDLIKNVDIDAREFALSCLKKSSDLGCLDAKVILIKYYTEGKYLPKNDKEVEVLEAAFKLK